MFKQAVEKVSQFTRPIAYINRKYKAESIMPGLATLFFVNDKGEAITCKHVAELLLTADEINDKYIIFKQERNLIMTKASPHKKIELRELEKKYGYSKETFINMKYSLIDCPTLFSKIDVVMHPKYDLAILKFMEFEQLNYNAGSVFG